MMFCAETLCVQKVWGKSSRGSRPHVPGRQAFASHSRVGTVTSLFTVSHVQSVNGRLSGTRSQKAHIR